VKYERLGEELLHQLKQKHRNREGEQAGKPELLYAIRHHVLLPSRSLNSAAKIVPILDLAESALGGILFRKSPSA